jgi:hypothetical protein
MNGTGVLMKKTMKSLLILFSHEDTLKEGTICELENRPWPNVKSSPGLWTSQAPLL